MDGQTATALQPIIDDTTPGHEVAPTAADEVYRRIERRAYELYEGRGRADGQDVEDWLRAEAEILKTQSPETTP